ncbi:TonB-dependent receptor [Parasphingorhabdus cellanae]|uniref:TonB-dependent receptor n=1 Tax=Parasphingorhabdus cellanae TaxID=2806553 RepID=A0ABX7T791_9SPHN|nr:TonB-dependent receptor [Parasphingorhabdus cellanae]QTD57475.1 TonB-dependent receptor [Parasphingorhabdus cellanae]
MRLRLLMIATLFGLCVSTPAAASPRYDINIPATKVDRALNQFSRQTGVSLGGINVKSATVKTSPVRGRYTLRQGLRRLLRGTNLSFKIIDRHTVRIFNKPARRNRPKAKPERVQAPKANRPVTPPVTETIVVTASKQGTMLTDYPGSVTVISPEANVSSASAKGIDAIIRQLPSSAETNLGSGRNKIFLRGIADSSFNGPSQSTLAMYLGDTRLAFNSPSPDLRLYDVKRVEILEGPQGTLYGAGSLGGAIRTIAEKPDISALYGSGWAQISLTKDGQPSAALAAMINMPINDDLAIRALGYVQSDGGYIDDAHRKLKDINKDRIKGGRASLLFKPGDSWSIEASAALQTIHTFDGQFAELGERALTRRSAIAQPFESEFAAYSMAIKKEWNNLNLVSATGLVNNRLLTRYDATALLQFDPSVPDTPLAFDERRKIRLISHETRLSGSGSNNRSWVAGISLIDNEDQLTSSLGLPNSPNQFSDVLGRTREAAIFGELSHPLTSTITGTVGARVVYTRFDVNNITQGGIALDLDREDVRYLPTIALGWRPDRRSLIYARYQKGYRPGGFSIDEDFLNDVDSSGARNIEEAVNSELISIDDLVGGIEIFRSDSIDTVEAGVRSKIGHSDQVIASASIFYSRWKNIQADIVDLFGFSETANIGDGTIYGITMGLEWQLTPSLTVTGKFFLNDSEVTNAETKFLKSEGGRLPNIANVGANAGFLITEPVSDALEVIVHSQLRYVGASQLGISPFFPLEQGDYITAGLGTALRSEKWTIFADVTNLFNSQANSFSLGNPFTVTNRQQVTPIRPLTVTIGFKADF